MLKAIVWVSTHCVNVQAEEGWGSVSLLTHRLTYISPPVMMLCGIMKQQFFWYSYCVVGNVFLCWSYCLYLHMTKDQMPHFIRPQLKIFLLLQFSQHYCTVFCAVPSHFTSAMQCKVNLFSYLLVDYSSLWSRQGLYQLCRTGRKL